MTLKIPRHPLPRRQGRPRRQRRQLRRSDRCRRSGGSRPRPMTPPVPMSSAFSTSPPRIRNRDTIVRRGRAHGGALLHAAHRWRRRAHGRGYPQAAARGRRQGLDQHRRGETTPIFVRRWQPTSSAASASSSPSTPRSQFRRRMKRRSLGDLHPWRPQADRHRRGRLMPKRSWQLGAGEILLTSMDRDGTKAGFDIGADPRHCRCGSVPVIASGGVGTLDHLVEGVREGMPPPCSPPRFSISEPIRSAKRKQHMAAAGLDMRLD
jgi:hypothetical protein